MNERKFLKEINNKSNKDGIFTCAIVLNLIDSQRKKLSLQKTSKVNSVFRRLFSKFNKEKSAEQIIADNFPEILERTSSSSIDLLITKLIEDSGTNHVITENLSIVLNRLIRDDTFKECNQEVFDKIIELPEGREFIENNIDTMLENVSPRNVFQISQYLKGLSDNIDERLNQALEDNRIEVAKSLLEDSLITRIDLENKEELVDEYKLTLSVMIDEVLESEKCRYIDIDYLSRGSYSNVYQIGSKVLKVGGPRQTYSMPNHRRILQPLTRTNFIDEKNKNQPFACIEISDKADPLLKGDIEEEKLYEIFRDLRKDGIIWTDIRFANIGRLSKKNQPSLNGEEMDVAPNSVGFTNDKDKRQLSIGDLVIIDTDFIYTEGDGNIVWQKDGCSERFEKRYQQEKAVEIAERYNKGELKTENRIEDKEK